MFDRRLSLRIARERSRLYRLTPWSRIACIAALGALVALPAHATIDATLNTTNFVSGQASELSVDGVISQGGTSTSINCAVLMIRFDPAKVTLSGVRSGPNGWGLAASNTSQLSAGWMKAILNNSSGDAGQGQTSSGPIMYFTVTPVDSSVNVNDCATLQLSGSESDLSDQDYETITPSDPCNGDYAPSGGPELPPSGTRSGSSGSNGPSAPAGCDPYLQNGIRILRIAAGLMMPLPSDNPNTGTPRTEQDVATLDMTNDGRITIEDAIVAFHVRGTEPTAAWSKEFVGNTLIMTCGNAANSTAMSAVSHLNPSDSSSPWIAAFAMGHINGKNYADPRVLDILDGMGNGIKSSNTNNVYVLQDLGGGVFGYRTNWPQPMRDGPRGITLANFASTSNVNVIASNFQDSYTLHWGILTGHSLSRSYVWTADAGSVDGFANADNPDSPNPNVPDDPDQAIGAVPGHVNTAPPVWDIDGPGGLGPLLLFPAEGEVDSNTLHIYHGGVAAFDASGVKKF